MEAIYIDNEKDNDCGTKDNLIDKTSPIVKSIKFMNAFK